MINHFFFLAQYAMSYAQILENNHIMSWFAKAQSGIKLDTVKAKLQSKLKAQWHTLGCAYVDLIAYCCISLGVIKVLILNPYILK